ncbi:hypothetical protein FS842_006090, partial [Serendipita sp. 407]
EVASKQLYSLFARVISRTELQTSFGGFCRRVHTSEALSKKKRQQTLAEMKSSQQQTSLNDMWTKKAAKVKKVSEPMEVEGEAETSKKASRVKAKRLSGSPEPNEEEEDVIMRPAAKKRRMVTSDDESSPTKLTKPSQSPKSKSTSSLKAPKTVASKPQKVVKPPKSVSSRASSVPLSVEEASEKESVAAEEEEEAGEGELSEVASEEAAVASKTAEHLFNNDLTMDFKGSWPQGEPAPYALITEAFSLIEGTTKRIEKTSYLTSLLYTVINRSRDKNKDHEPDVTSVLQTVYLCINRLSPDYIGIELGIGESLLIKAITESTGRSVANIKADLKKEGDLGLVAMNSKANQKMIVKPKTLTVPVVFARLKEIALTSGAQSQAKKTSIITKLLAACQSKIAD